MSPLVTNDAHYLFQCRLIMLPSIPQATDYFQCSLYCLSYSSLCHAWFLKQSNLHYWRASDNNILSLTLKCGRKIERANALCYRHRFQLRLANYVPLGANCGYIVGVLDPYFRGWGWFEFLSIVSSHSDRCWVEKMNYTSNSTHSCL